MSDGYAYCKSNESMPGILKIGMTKRTPEARLREANASDTWRPPTPYKIEFAKKVSNVSEKEKTLHSLLEQYTDRIHPRREFFRISIEEVRKFFDLMDGEMWIETCLEHEEEEEEEEEEDENTSLESVSRVKTPSVKGCRDMTKCFTNGQRIRHTIGINKTWIGIYDSSRNGIVYNGDFYKSLSGFAETHYSIVRTDRCKSANGWKECECEMDGNWISTYSLSG
jgi:T5orf172 domain